MTTRAEPMGGPLDTPLTRVLAGLFGLATLAIAWRLIAGLGATTALNDGYPLGLWIAFDVVTGTALACGGYAIALLVYILNKGRYHPLVRPAMLTSALGYSLAGVSVLLDVGRWWLIWKVPVYFWHWNFNSALLEIALCIMSYVVVLWIELSPALLEKFVDSTILPLRRVARKVPPIDRARVAVHHRARAAAADDAPVVARHVDAAGRIAAAPAVAHAAAAAAVPDHLPGDGIRRRGVRVGVLERRVQATARDADARALATAIVPLQLAAVALRLADLWWRGSPGSCWPATRVRCWRWSSSPCSSRRSRCCDPPPAGAISAAWSARRS